MISVNLIQKHFEAGRIGALVDALAANGMELPLALRIRLLHDPASAIALGLRRVVELTYGPTSLSREMTSRLLASQGEDGSFGKDPLATAAAASAVSLLLCDHPAADQEPLELAHERAIASLAAMQGEDGLFHSHDAGIDRTHQESAMTSAFVLFLLGRNETFRAAVRLADLVDWFEQHEDELDEPTRQLWRLARNHAPTLRSPSPMFAAIAA